MDSKLVNFLWGIAYGGGQFVATGSNGNVIYSTDALPQPPMLPEIAIENLAS